MFALSQRMEIEMGDLSLPSRLATAAETLNIEVSKERLRITHKTYLMHTWYLPGKNGGVAYNWQLFGSCSENFCEQK